MTKEFELGTYESMAISYFPLILKKAMQDGLILSLTIRTEWTNADLFTQLLNDQLHIIVVADPEDHPQIDQVPLFKEKYEFYKTPHLHIKNNPQENHNVFTIDDLKSTPFFCFPLAITGEKKEIDVNLIQLSMKIRHFHKLNSFQTVKAFTLKDLGFSILPVSIAREDVKANRLEPIIVKDIAAKPFGEHQFYACYKKIHASNPLTQVMLKIIQESIS